MERFLSEDPLGFNAGDANLYRCVFNSPTNYTDPSGEAALVTLAAVGGVKAIKAVGAVLVLGALNLNNQLQSEETREALEDFAQRCLETVTGGYNPDFDPNRPNREMPIPPAIDWGENLQAPPMNPGDLNPEGFGTEPQPEVDSGPPPFGAGLDEPFPPYLAVDGGALGIPENWNTKPSKKSGGTIFINPGNPHDRVRVMPGNPSSPNVAQQGPYVKRQKDGKFFDKDGNEVSSDSEEAHIPLKDFSFF